MSQNALPNNCVTNLFDLIFVFPRNLRRFYNFCTADWYKLCVELANEKRLLTMSYRVLTFHKMTFQILHSFCINLWFDEYLVITLRLISQIFCRLVFFRCFDGDSILFRFFVAFVLSLFRYFIISILSSLRRCFASSLLQFFK